MESPSTRGAVEGRVLQVLCVLAVTLGIVFRLHDLGGPLAWHDEVATRVFCAGHSPEDWRERLYSGVPVPVEDVQRWQRVEPGGDLGHAVRGLATKDPQHPPFYYVLAWIWVRVWGDDVGTLRALSALGSLLGLPAWFLAGRCLFGSRRAGWIAMAIASVSPFFVLYAREAREYALWTTFVVAATASLFAASRASESASTDGGGGSGSEGFTWRPWAAYGAWMALSFATSFSTVWIAASHTLWVLWDRRLRFDRPARGAAAALVVVALLFLPWAVQILRNWEAFEISMRWSREIHIPRSSLLRLFVLNAGRVTVDFWPDLDRPAAWMALLPASMLLLGSHLLAFRRGARGASALLVALGAVPLLATLGPDLLGGGIRSVASRYLTPLWIGSILALSGWLAGGRGDGGRSRLGRTTVLALLLAAATGSLVHNHREPAPWTKGTGIPLSRVARAIRQSPSPLVIGDMEHHNPGDLLALSNLLAPGTHMQFLRMEMQENYELPPNAGAVWLYNPIPPLRDRLLAVTGGRLTPVVEALDLVVYRLDP